MGISKILYRTDVEQRRQIRDHPQQVNATKSRVPSRRAVRSRLLAGFTRFVLSIQPVGIPAGIPAGTLSPPGEANRYEQQRNPEENLDSTARRGMLPFGQARATQGQQNCYPRDESDCRGARQIGVRMPHRGGLSKVTQYNGQAQRINAGGKRKGQRASHRATPSRTCPHQSHRRRVIPQPSHGHLLRSRCRHNMLPHLAPLHPNWVSSTDG